jgi:hypothetical protein
MPKTLTSSSQRMLQELDKPRISAPPARFAPNVSSMGGSQEFGIFGGLTPAERGTQKTQVQPQRLPLIDLLAQKRFIEKASISQISRRYKVEPRTVQRWRKILKNYDQKEQHETQR